MIRIGQSLIAMIRALDILACALWLGGLYPLRLASRPTGRQTISGYIGKAAFNGHRWAIRAAAVIDRGAMLLGDAPQHCYRAYLFYRPVED